MLNPSSRLTQAIAVVVLQVTATASLHPSAQGCSALATKAALHRLPTSGWSFENVKEQ